MWVVTYRKVWFALSTLIIAASLWAAFTYGFNLSIDFTGGAITEVSYASRPDKALVEENIGKIGIGGFSVRPSGEHNYIIRTKDLDNLQHDAFLKALAAGGEAPKVERANSIG